MIIEIIKAIILGIVEGVTEWLPISSTGHMILVESLMPLNVSKEFYNMFLVVIQLGAILAVCIEFFSKLNPWYGRKNAKVKYETFQLWGKIIVGCIPAGVIGVLFNDWFEEHLNNVYVVAATLIAYGILFILLENRNRKRTFKVKNTTQLTYPMAFAIGCFQTLALVPGTSRSGATILGAMLIGVARTPAAEFSFFLSAPVMFGASLLKVVKFMKNGVSMTGTEVGVLLIGTAVAFGVSVLAIRFLMGYVKKHDFKVFGYYRIILGIIVLAYFLLL